MRSTPKGRSRESRTSRTLTDITADKSTRRAAAGAPTVRAPTACRCSASFCHKRFAKQVKEALENQTATLGEIWPTSNQRWIRTSGSCWTVIERRRRRHSHTLPFTSSATMTPVPLFLLRLKQSRHVIVQKTPPLSD